MNLKIAAFTALQLIKNQFFSNFYFQLKLLLLRNLKNLLKFNSFRLFLPFYDIRDYLNIINSFNKMQFPIILFLFLHSTDLFKFHFRQLFAHQWYNQKNAICIFSPISTFDCFSNYFLQLLFLLPLFPHQNIYLHTNRSNKPKFYSFSTFL